VLERLATTSDDLVAQVVLRRFASGSPDPLVSAVVSGLARAVREDHVALDLEAPTGLGVLGVSGFESSEVLSVLEREPNLCEFLGASVEPQHVGAPLVVVDRRYLYLRRLAVAEFRVAATLAESRANVLDLPGGLDLTAFDEAAAALTEELAAAGTPSRELADIAGRCFTRRVSFLVGGPGTGKTWLVTQMLRLLDRALATAGDVAPLNFAVAAPTGKAARRVAQTIDEVLAGDGFTRLVRDHEREGSLHRLLSLHPSRSAQVRALHYDVVVVDEVSMADLTVLDVLLRATHGDAGHVPRVILVGDPHQLASVNVGAVLADAVNPEAGDEALISTLTTVHRTGHRPLIDLAAAVNAGDVVEVARLLRSGGVIGHHRDPEDLFTVRRVIDHAGEVGDLAAAGDGHGALATLRRRSVLAATLEGPGSVAWWNARVGAHHRRLFPVVAGERFSVGEPVLVMRNQRALNLSNGDLGVVVEHGGRRVIYFEGDRVVPVGGVGYLETAWAMTIHKSQGSEFDEVVVVLANVESPLLSRELLYTAITRASDSVTLLASSEAIDRAVATSVSRVSGLTHRLAHWPGEARAT
jgi:exodeoxyribonuclease V alpha subunit